MQKVNLAEAQEEVLTKAGVTIQKVVSSRVAMSKSEVIQGGMEHMLNPIIDQGRTNQNLIIGVRKAM